MNAQGYEKLKRVLLQGDSEIGLEPWRLCGQVLYGEGSYKARCVQFYGVEHSHHDLTAEQAVRMRVATKV